MNDPTRPLAEIDQERREALDYELNDVYGRPRIPVDPMDCTVCRGIGTVMWVNSGGDWLTHCTRCGRVGDQAYGEERNR